MMNTPFGGRPGPPALWRKWMGLLLGVLLILVFIFGITPWVQQLPMVRPLAEYIEESGIEATGLFYTEVEETGDAENYLRNTMRFTPRRR